MREVPEEVIIDYRLLSGDKSDQQYDAAQVGHDPLPVKKPGDEYIYIEIKDADQKEVIYQFFNKEACM
ncbi:hypothetical protein ACDQ55_07930 [Chitinophaga sp. 30R24]|uniref:hypothetical protein n=1 Tax=Chitinophaga sp. 30R24 TaxID=3248838 RepID=UPI003B920E0A